MNADPGVMFSARFRPEVTDGPEVSEQVLVRSSKELTIKIILVLFRLQKSPRAPIVRLDPFEAHTRSTVDLDLL